MFIISIIKYFIVLIPSLILKLVLKINHKEIWLISEESTSAQDNGYYLFKYIRCNNPNDKVYYAIDFKSKDYKKVEPLGNIIKWGSLKHYLYYLVAKNITTNEFANPSPKLFYFLHIKLNLYNNRVFLQRGITKDDIKSLYYDKTKFKLFVCGAKREYEYIKDNYNYPNNYVKYLGFPRFDELEGDYNNKQILIMPTYRKIKDSFNKSLYFKRWNSLINNKELIRCIEDNDITIYFYLHKKMQKYINSFNTTSKNIKIVNDEDINNLLKESSLLITDYSSVYMDFAYMNKPIIYYQFDYNDYRNNMYKEGYFKYAKDAFGKLILDEEDLVKKIIAYIEMNYKTEKIYIERSNKFFEEKNNMNSKRVYETIKEINN